MFICKGLSYTSYLQQHIISIIDYYSKSLVKNIYVFDVFFCLNVPSDMLPW